MLSSLRARVRRLLSAGAAGDARSAGGRDIASNIAVQLSIRVVSIAISVVTVSLTARTLEPGGLGVYNAMESYVGLFGVLTDFGFTTATLRRMTAEPELESEWLGALAGVRVGLSIVVAVICAITVPLLLSDAYHGHAVGLIATLTILSTGPNALMTVFQARMRSGLAQSFGLLASFIWLGATIVLAIVHGSTVAFAAANVGMIAIIATLQIAVTRRHVHIAWRAGRRHWRELFAVAFPIGIAGILITVYYQIDSVLLLQLGGPHEAGIYSAAYTFLSPLMFLPAAIMSSFFPVLSSRHRADDAGRIHHLVQVCAETMAVIGVPVLAGSIALAVPIVHLLYGHGFARTAAILPILMIAFVSICFGSLAGYMAPILQLQWRLALYSGLGAVANVVLNVVLIPRYGAFGSAWATVATEIFTMLLMLTTSLRALRLRIAPGKLARTVLVGAAMTEVMFACRPLGLFPAGIIGLLAYAAGLLALRVFSWQELRRLRSG